MHLKVPKNFLVSSEVLKTTEKKILPIDCNVYDIPLNAPTENSFQTITVSLQKCMEKHQNET